MKQPDQILDAVRKHCADGMQQYPDFESAAQACSTITDYLALATSAAGHGDVPPTQETLARNLLRVAGLCVKTMVNFDLPCPLPKAPVVKEPETRASDAP